MKKASIYFCILSLLFFCSCAELERDNVLDPKNPNSERPRVVLIEAFVNDYPAVQYCANALDGLMNLEAEFGNSQLIILEYHYNEVTWQDEYAIQEANVRYNELAPSSYGFPDVFFNGADSRIQGAYSAESAYQRYRDEFGDELNTAGLYTIEAQVSTSSNQTTVNVSVARLGNTSVSNISIHAVVVHDMGDDRHRHVVKSVLLSQMINRLEAGEIEDVTFTFPTSLSSANNASLVLFVYDENAGNKNVLQAHSLTL